MGNCTNPNLPASRFSECERNFHGLPMYGEDPNPLVTCFQCGDVHPEWMRKEVKSERAGANIWVDVVCPSCECPNYQATTIEDYAQCLRRLAFAKGVRLKLADFNAMPYAWCLNTTPNDFLNAVEAVHLNQ